jgi:hypothetical protein
MSHRKTCEPQVKIWREIYRIHLRGGGRAFTAAHMKCKLTILIAGAVVISACQKKETVTVTETRGPTTRDRSPKLFATSDERFRDSKPSPVKGDTPENWLALPASQFRLLNYRFGESGMGEVWVSLSSGTVLNNVNRWLTQFGAATVDADGLEKLPPATIFGMTGKWVEAAGEYASGMGAPPQSGFALAGVVTAIDGQILTLKMVGPKAEVEAAKPVLEQFSKSLRKAE